MSDAGATPKGRRSLGALLSDVPRLLGDLLRAEIDSIKAELKATVAGYGIGAGLFAVAALLALYALIALVLAAIAGIAVALPWWAAALIVGGALLLLAGIAAFLGITAFKKAKPDVGKHVDSVKADVRAVRGLPYDDLEEE